MVMTNLTTGDKTVLYFQPCGWLGAGRYEIDGYVYNAAEEPKVLMTGKWKEVFRVADVPKDDKYQYTYFAHKINSFSTAPRKVSPSIKATFPRPDSKEQAGGNAES